MIHSDLSGIISPPSMGGGRYYFKLTDSATSYKFVYILKHKSETLSTFMKFKSFFENQKNLTIKSMVNNNGGEYVGTAFKDFTENMVLKCI